MTGAVERPVDPRTPGVPATIDGRYRVGEPLGQGAMGEVRRAHDTRLDREVAIKVLRAELAADPDVRSRFEHEARAAAALTDSAIVTVFDTGEWRGVPYLVMERLPGRTLAHDIAGGPLPAERVRSVALDVGKALVAAHRVGIVHRDVKPGNILLTESTVVKLADFGIAKSMEAGDRTMTGLILGTPAYLAPERLAGEPATTSSDLYSLGVVLYEALCGENPFRGDTPIAVGQRTRGSRPEPIASRVPGCEPALASAIDLLMAADPADRPASAEELVASLRGSPAPTRVPISEGSTAAGAPTRVMSPALAAPTVAAPVRGPLAVGDRVGRGRAPVVAALAGFVALVVIALVWSAWPRGVESRGPSSTTVSTTRPAAPLPEPLDKALRDLEGSVHP
jgi:serine/threonine-protein kinase